MLTRICQFLAIILRYEIPSRFSFRVLVGAYKGCSSVPLRVLYTGFNRIVMHDFDWLGPKGFKFRIWRLRFLSLRAEV